MYRIIYKIRCDKCDETKNLYEVEGPTGLQYFCRDCLNTMEVENSGFIDIEDGEIPKYLRGVVRDLHR